MNSPIHLQQREAVLTVPKIPVSPMGAIWRTIRGYILWSYERGSLHYDIMVTLILMFVFVTPHYVNFKDRPVERTPSATGVLIIPGDKGGFLYQIPAAAITTAADSDLRDQFQRIIEPIAGAVSITKYEPVKDPTGHTQSYKVWVNKD
jgi:hypothetical protein